MHPDLPSNLTYSSSNYLKSCSVNVLNYLNIQLRHMVRHFVLSVYHYLDGIAEILVKHNLFINQKMMIFILKFAISDIVLWMGHSLAIDHVDYIEEY